MLRTLFLHPFIFVLSALLWTSSAFTLAADDHTVEDQPQVLERVRQLEQKGILKQKPNGYLYLEVAKEFVAEPLLLIEAPGKIVPPQHYKSKKGIGAHISVMYKNGQILNEIWEINELGKEFGFTIKELRSVKLNKNNKVQKLWMLAVAAPELEKLRESYGLPSKLKGHEFHITIGSQVPGPSQAKIEKLANGYIQEQAAA